MDITEKLSFVSADDEYGAAEVPQLITDLTVVDDRLVIHRADGSEEITKKWSGPAASEIDTVEIDDLGSVISHMNTSQINIAQGAFSKINGKVAYSGKGIYDGYAPGNASINPIPDDFYATRNGEDHYYLMPENLTCSEVSPGKYLYSNGVYLESVANLSVTALPYLFLRNTNYNFRAITGTTVNFNLTFPKPVNINTLQVLRDATNSTSYINTVKLELFDEDNILIAQSTVSATNGYYDTPAGETRKVKYLKFTTVSTVGSSSGKAICRFHIAQKGVSESFHFKELRFGAPHFRVAENVNEIVVTPNLLGSTTTFSEDVNVARRAMFQILPLTKANRSTTVNSVGPWHVLQFNKTVFDAIGIGGSIPAFELPAGRYKYSFCFNNIRYIPGMLGLRVVNTGQFIDRFLRSGAISASSSTIAHDGYFTIGIPTAVEFVYYSTAIYQFMLLNSLHPHATIEFWQIANPPMESDLPLVTLAPNLTLRPTKYELGYFAPTPHASFFSTDIVNTSPVNIVSVNSVVTIRVDTHFRLWSRNVVRPAASANHIHLYKIGKGRSNIYWGVLPPNRDLNAIWEPITIKLPPGTYEFVGIASRYEYNWFVEYITEEDYAKEDLLLTEHNLVEPLTSSTSSYRTAIRSTNSSTSTYQVWKVFSKLPSASYLSAVVTDLTIVPVWIEVEFYTQQTIYGYNILSNAAFSNREYWPKAWKVFYKDASGAWALIQEVTMVEDNDGQVRLKFPTAVKCNILRFEFTQANVSTTQVGFNALEIMGPNTNIDPELF